jgi:hypothetical protein
LIANKDAIKATTMMGTRMRVIAPNNAGQWRAAEQPTNADMYASARPLKQPSYTNKLDATYSDLLSARFGKNRNTAPPV